MSEWVTVDSVATNEALVVGLSGVLTVATATQAAVLLHAATDALPPPGRVVIDVRELATISAAGGRVLHELAKSSASRGVDCSVVVEPGSTAASVLLLTDRAQALPCFPDLAAALAAPNAHTTELTSDANSDAANPDELVEQFEVLTRTLLVSTTVGEALRQIVKATLNLVTGAEMVSVTLRSPGGELFTPTSTDPVATELDKIQYSSGQGPCVDAARPDAPGYTTSDDLSIEQRWPDFAAAAAGHGYRAVLSTELFPPTAPEHLSGALNIYRHQPGPFSKSDRHTALLLATHASLALAHVRAVELADFDQLNLRKAIDSRDVIGQAKGILMNRQQITADEAFELLSRTSQEINVKLVDLARALADRHGELDLPEMQQPHSHP